MLLEKHIEICQRRADAALEANNYERHERWQQAANQAREALDAYLCALNDGVLTI